MWSSWIDLLFMFIFAGLLLLFLIFCQIESIFIEPLLWAMHFLYIFRYIWLCFGTQDAVQESGHKRPPVTFLSPCFAWSALGMCHVKIAKKIKFPFPSPIDGANILNYRIFGKMLYIFIVVNDLDTFLWITTDSLDLVIFNINYYLKHQIEKTKFWAGLSLGL